MPLIVQQAQGAGFDPSCLFPASGQPIEFDHFWPSCEQFNLRNHKGELVESDQWSHAMAEI